MRELTSEELAMLSDSLWWRCDHYRTCQKTATEKQYEEYQYRIDKIEDLEKRIEDEITNRIGGYHDKVSQLD